MNMKRIFRDALILCLITLVAGFALGATHEVTDPLIKEQRVQAAQKTYKEVFPEAASFSDESEMANAVEVSKLLIENTFGEKITVDSALKAYDANGKVIGLIVNATSKEGYGGAVSISAGIDLEKYRVTGVGFLTLNETPGLGMKAKEPLFRDQFPGKRAGGEELEVIKTGTANDLQVQAISGATKTSRAVTHALNAAIFFAAKCVEITQ